MFVHTLDDGCVIDESSLLEDAVESEPKVDTGPVGYEIIERAAQRGNPLLVDSRGYSYGVHRRSEDSVLWRCTTRSSCVNCRAIVRQEGDVFTPGSLFYLVT